MAASRKKRRQISKKKNTNVGVYALIFLLISAILTVFLSIYSASNNKKTPGLNTKAQLAVTPSTLIKTTLTSNWSPASPDPSGITYWPLTGNFLISDGEVEEMTIFQNKNVYEISRNGTLVKTSLTTIYSKEPTGMAVNPSNGHIFVSDDDKKTIFEIALGADNQLNTADDVRTSFKTLPFGSSDPEGLAFGDGAVFIADGLGSEVYKITPGTNLIFEGGGDDVITHFDTSGAGETDPEGIEYNQDTNTLFVVGHGNKTKMLEFSLSGTPLRLIDITATNAKNPSGLAYGPSSDNPSKKSFYIVDRAVDNNTNPAENDGKLYEVRIEATTSSPTATPQPSITTNPSPTISTSPGQSLILTPILDTHVRADLPTRSYPSNPDLKVDGTPISITYMKFDTAAASGKQIASVKLQLYVIKDASKMPQSIKSITPSSLNSGVTYLTKPVSGNTIATIISRPLNAWIETDITTYAAPKIGQQIALSIEQTDTDGTFYASSESAQKPTLIITYK